MDLVNHWVVHDTEDCTFELDEYRTEAGEQMLLAHLRVHKWSKESMRRIKHAWQVFRSVVKVPIYANPMQDDPKWVRFVTLMGWRPFTKVLCQDGIERPLYIHACRTQLDQGHNRAMRLLPNAARLGSAANPGACLPR